MDDPQTAMKAQKASEKTQAEIERQQKHPTLKEKEHGGPKGPEPTRFGDWEVAGRCTDF